MIRRLCTLKAKLNDMFSKRLINLGLTNVNYARFYLQMSPKIPMKFMSLEEFMFRTSVRSTYREFLRKISKSHEKDDLRKFVREEFRAGNHVSDLAQRKYMLHEGKKRMDQFLKMIGLLSFR